jgi:hypothetical protein
VLAGGGHARAHHIEALRSGIEAEQDPGVKKLAVRALRLLVGRSPAMAGAPNVTPEAVLPAMSRARERGARTRRVTRNRSPGPDDSQPHLAGPSPASTGPLGVPGKRAP